MAKQHTSSHVARKAHEHVSKRREKFENSKDEFADDLKKSNRRDRGGKKKNRRW
jgi:predicted RNA-binding protein with RPS1 domain